MAGLNRFDVVVASCRPSDPYAWLFAGNTRFAARKWPGIEQGEKIAISIRPEDVLLSDGHPGRVSARNVLPGRVRSIKHGPEGSRVTLDVGVPLVSIITTETEHELHVRLDAALYAVVKATAITPMVEFQAGVRVSLLGVKGVLDPNAVDFLRMVARTGSLSSAAQELGISFRTAWMRARAINHSWERPLLLRASGGKGGGGSALTPEGMAAVAYADRLESRCKSL